MIQLGRRRPRSILVQLVSLVFLLGTASLLRMNNQVLPPIVCSAASPQQPQPQQHHQIVSTADNALPMSLSTVVSDLEAEGCNELSTACLVASRSVTPDERVRLLEQLLQAGDISHNAVAGPAHQWRAVATTAALALAQPPTASIPETAAAACACGGTLLYYASKADLQRREGLMDALAPAMEKIMSSTTDPRQRHLYILVDDSQDKAWVRRQLEAAAQPVLAHLVVGGSDGNGDNDNDSNNNNQVVTTLEDVFDHVDCIAPSRAVAAVVRHETTTPAAVAAQVAQLWNPQELVRASLYGAGDALGTGSGSGGGAANLAAARKLGPAARRRVREALQTVAASCHDNAGNPKLVPQFGQLGDAAFRRAVSDFDDSISSALALRKSAAAQQIRANLVAELDGALHDLWGQQVELLQLAEFEEFKRALSKLLVSPNLAQDMQAAAQKSVASFAAAAQKLVPKQASKSSGGHWSAAPARQRYARQLREHVANRLLAARAGNKFKPLPRRGVTVGLHWLLPKPFGNDYRQEPWMVHAVDDMVYVPQASSSGSKLGDVSAEEVTAGDWRNKIVPSPAGNDMLYMQ